MATTIVTKYGGDAPAASDIVRGELAVDTENGRLYTENSSGAVVELGLNPEGDVDVTGTVTADGVTSTTSSSMTQLTVNGTGAIESGINFANGGTTYGQIYFNNVSPYDMSVLQQYSTGSLIFGTNDTERMRIDSSGNVGIGTSSPDYTLDLGGATPVIRIGDAGSIQPTLTRNNSTGGLTYDTTGQSITSLIEFKDNGSERMRIDSSGNVKVNDGYLEVNTESTAAAVVRVDYNATDSIRRIHALETGGGNARPLQIHAQDVRFRDDTTERMRIDASGSILFGSAGQGYISGTVANTYNSGYNQDDDSWATWMNYYGYQNGATRYRDFIVGDGKTGRIATFDGSSGNVGIGTSNPTANLELSAATSRKLDVVDTTGARVRLSTASGQGFLGTTTNHDQLFITNDTERMRIDTSGNVGIGTTSPDHALEITAANGSQFKISRDLSPDTQYMTIGAGGNSVTFDSYETSTHSTYIWESSISGSTLERMRIDASGNVGIGLTNPADYYAENLVVAAADEGGITIECAATEKAYLMFARGTSGSNAYRSYIGYDHNVDSMNIVSSGYMNFYTDFPATEKMRIDESGNLLVGGALADVNGLATNHLFEGANSTVGTGAVGVYNNTGTASCPALVVLNRDASTDSSNRFVQFYANVTSSTNTAMGGIVGNGASNVQFATISDVREKTNIESITGSLDKITSLNPVEFDWIASGEHVNAGFVAQEVEEVFPEFVVENMASEGEEERKGLTGGMTSGIVAHLVKAIQEQQDTIEALTARIAALES